MTQAIEQTHSEDLEFWRLPMVVQKTGLSKSELYRRIEAGTFPRAKRYPGSKVTFWPSTAVRAWQQEILREAA